MRRVLMILVFMGLVFCSSSGFAQSQTDSWFFPSRLRVLVHGGAPITRQFSIKGLFVPSPNIAQEKLTPLVYLGIKWAPSIHFSMVGNVGWSFIGDNPFLSLMLDGGYGVFVTGTQLDYNFINHEAYSFTYADFIVLKWLILGAEFEAWGLWSDATAWSYGGGPNILFRFGKVGVDIAFHVRYVAGKVGGDLFLRVHLFLF